MEFEDQKILKKSSYLLLIKSYEKGVGNCTNTSKRKIEQNYECD